MSRRSGLLLAAMLVASPAVAADGVYEINQTCALNTGCFPGDTAGFPVTTSMEGQSYRLTGSLVTTSPSSTAINFQFVPDNTIDLNGFSISSMGCPGSCDTGGQALLVGPRTAVRNGSIRGFQYAVRSNSDEAITVEGLQIESSVKGVLVGAKSLVRDNKITVSGAASSGSGIETGDNSIVSQNTLGVGGIETGNNSLVSYNALDGSDTYGIFGGGTISSNSVRGFDISIYGGTVVRDNTVSGGQVGISAIGTIVDNLVSSSQTGINDNAGSSSVRGNTVFVGSGGTGLALSSTSAFSDNVIDTTGTTVSGGVDTGGNLCNGSTTCP